MQELDFEGLFWRPEAPDRKIAGRLRFDPTAGAILSFIEPLRFSRTENTRMSLTDLLGAQSEDKDGIRFLGVAGPHKLTLDQCRLSASSLQSNSFIQRRYQVTSILTGAHLGTEDPLIFTSVSVQLGNLVSWVGHSGLSVDRLPAEPEKLAGIRLTYESVPSIETETDDGSIAVAFPWRCQLNPLDKSMLEQSCAIEYRFLAPQPFSKIIRVCSSLRNLVTICAHTPSDILDTKLTHADVDRAIDLYTKWIGAGTQQEQKEDALIRRSRMAFTFDDIGGLEGIRSWLKLANRYSVVVALLVSHWYVPTLYQEQRYFNAFVAAETLIRIRKKEKHVNLKEKFTMKEGLQELAGEVDAVFAPLVGDLTAWAQEVVRTRDNFVVHPGLRGNSDGYRLYLLSESIYLLVVLTLLRDCSVAIDSLKNIQNHEHFKWLAAELVTSA